MMPIRPDQRDRYPINWRDISKYVRFERAQGRCECTGECGSPRHLAWQVEEDELRCPATHCDPSPLTGSTVVITTAHLDHTPENCDETNLRAMCQACHLAYDREHHAATRATTRAAIPAPLPNGDCPACPCGLNGAHPPFPGPRTQELRALKRLQDRG